MLRPPSADRLKVDLLKLRLQRRGTETARDDQADPIVAATAVRDAEVDGIRCNAARIFDACEHARLVLFGAGDLPDRRRIVVAGPQPAARGETIAAGGP